jgi:hypothetical protein
VNVRNTLTKYLSVIKKEEQKFTTSKEKKNFPRERKTCIKSTENKNDLLQN